MGNGPRRQILLTRSGNIFRKSPSPAPPGRGEAHDVHRNRVSEYRRIRLDALMVATGERQRARGIRWGIRIVRAPQGRLRSRSRCHGRLDNSHRPACARPWIFSNGSALLDNGPQPPPGGGFPLTTRLRSTGSPRFARGYSQNPRPGTDLSAEGAKPPSRQEKLADKSADSRITPSRCSATERRRVPTSVSTGFDTVPGRRGQLFSGPKSAII